MRRKLWLVVTVLVIAAAGVYVLWSRQARPDAATPIASSADAPHSEPVSDTVSDTGSAVAAPTASGGQA